jgi:hypothetical protein
MGRSDGANWPFIDGINGTSTLLLEVVSGKTAPATAVGQRTTEFTLRLERRETFRSFHVRVRKCKKCHSEVPYTT